VVFVGVNDLDRGILGTPQTSDHSKGDVENVERSVKVGQIALVKMMDE